MYEGGSNLRLKRGRSRSRGRSTNLSTSALVETDYDSQRMTRSRSKSRGRVPVIGQQHGGNKKGTPIGSPAAAHIESTSRFSGSSGLVYKADRCSVPTIKTLQRPRPELQQETLSNCSRVIASPLPSRVFSNASRRLPLPVQAQNKPSSMAPFGLPMFSFLSTPNPANQASRKRPQDSFPPMNYGKRHNSNTDELPGCKGGATQDLQIGQTNARSNQIIVSPLNRLFNDKITNQMPEHSGFSQCKMQRLSSYPENPDIEIMPAPANANDNTDCVEESHSATPRNSGFQISSSCGTDTEKPTLSPSSSNVDARPVKRIPLHIRKERSISTISKTSTGGFLQEKSSPGKEAYQETGRMCTNMQWNDVIITPVCNLTDDEDDGCCVSPTSYTSVSSVEDEGKANPSEEANHDLELSPPSAPLAEMSNHNKCTHDEQISVVPVMEQNNAVMIENYDDNDAEEEEYHDTFQDVDELHEPANNLIDEEIVNPKKKWCTIV